MPSPSINDATSAQDAWLLANYHLHVMHVAETRKDSALAAVAGARGVWEQAWCHMVTAACL
jgi:hypothetical protein